LTLLHSYESYHSMCIRRCIQRAGKSRTEVSQVDTALICLLTFALDGEKLDPSRYGISTSTLDISAARLLGVDGPTMRHRVMMEWRGNKYALLSKHTPLHTFNS
jgi:hypothetical protein